MNDARSSDAARPPAGGGHLDDLLSAYVDGQLSSVEQAVVDAHVASCPQCRAELDATRAAKNWVAELPPVEPPFGFYERMLLDGAGPRRRRARWPVRLGAVALAATAAIWFGVIGLGRIEGSRPGMPALNSFVDLHLKTPAPATPKPATPEAEQQAQTLGLPNDLSGGFQLVRVEDEGGDERWALYSNGDTVISVFVAAGQLDPRALPSGSVLTRTGDAMAWLVPSEAGEMAVTQRGDSVVVVVGPVLGGPSVAEGVDPPSFRDSIVDDLESAGRGLFQAFGLG